jgi:hypothetical protein
MLIYCSAFLIAQSFTGVDTTISEFRIRTYGRTSAGVLIVNPDGKKVSGEVIKEVKAKDARYVEISVKDPAPGCWQIVISDDSSRKWHIWVPQIINPAGVRVRISDTLLVRAWIVSGPVFNDKDFSTAELHLTTGREHTSYLLEMERCETHPGNPPICSWIFTKKVPIQKPGNEIELAFSFYHVPSMTNIIVTKRVAVK